MSDFQLVPMICAASTLRCPSSRRRCMRYEPSVPDSGVSAKGFGARKEAVTPGIKMATRLCRFVAESAGAPKSGSTCFRGAFESRSATKVPTRSC
jgi:hypothetical protein